MGVRHVDAAGRARAGLEAGGESGLPGQGEVAGVAVGVAFELEDGGERGADAGVIVGGAGYGGGRVDEAFRADGWSGSGGGGCGGGFRAGPAHEGGCWGGDVFYGAPDALVADLGADFAFEIAGARGSRDPGDVDAAFGISAGLDATI